MTQLRVAEINNDIVSDLCTADSLHIRVRSPHCQDPKAETSGPTPEKGQDCKAEWC